MRTSKLFFVDVETTDLPENDPGAEIIEIATAVLDLDTWAVTDEWSTLVAHSAPMGAFTQKAFTGVDFTGAPLSWWALTLLLKQWEKCAGAWTGQNPDFDRGMVRSTSGRMGVDFIRPPGADYHVFDVASMMLPYVLRGEVESVSLRNTRLWAGQFGEQTHRAPGDVRDTIAVLLEILVRSKGAEPATEISPGCQSGKYAADGA
jgi:hypothetical protein